MQAGAAPAVADVGVEAALQQPLGISHVAVDAGLKQRHPGLAGIIDKY
ncbi:hypothetical protein scyTo_0026653, partial [Scyliorhinus torazame]|nr:hypothetical protein [Scyliorhinus torazame]